MKTVKRVAIVLFVYVGIVVAFESLIGVLQPTAGETLVITTRGADGATHDRVLAHLQSGDQLYVAANHWPRAWYERALANPNVEVTIDGERSAHRAVRVEGAEYERVNADNSLGLGFRILTGFPPRHILRLDPR